MSPYFENAADFIKKNERKSQKHGQRWGNWRLNAANLTLEHVNGGYYVDLEKMNTSAQMLDWIFQVRGKVWASDQDMGNLLTALDEIFRPQATLCSGGLDQQFDVSQHLQPIKVSAPKEAKDDEEEE